MQSPRRFLTALAVAGSAMLLFSSGVFAAGNGNGHKSAPAPKQSHGAAAPQSSGCDVPGRACDPSKTDHDNGVGNNCDPGYGQGNQAKFPSDETESGCRTSGVAPSPSPAPSSSPSPMPSASPTSGTGGTSGTTIEVNKNVIKKIEKLIFLNRSQTTTITLVLNGTSSQTQNVVITITGTGSNTTVTVNGQTLTVSQLQSLISGILAQLQSNGTVTIGTGTQQITITQTAPGTFTITLPNGTVLTFTGGVLSSGGTTIPTGSTGQVGGTTVVNQAPSASTGTGSVSANTSTAPAATTGLGGVAATVGSAVNAAAGLPLAETGLPLIGGLVGLILLGLGFMARRRS